MISDGSCLTGMTGGSFFFLGKSLFLEDYYFIPFLLD